MIPVFGRTTGSGAAPPTPALISNVALAPSGSNGGTSAAITTTGANIIILATSSATTVAVSDSKSNTWTLIDSAQSTFAKSSLYYCINPTVGTLHTFSCTGLESTVAAAAFSGGAGGLDQTNKALSNATATTIQPGSITPAFSGELIVTSFAMTAPGAASINSSFAITDQVNTGNSWGDALAYLVQGAAAAVNPTWTGASQPSRAAVIASFKAG